MPEQVSYEYNCVAAPPVIAVKNQDQRHKAVENFQDIINEQADGGWEYVGIDEFQTVEPQGCLGLGGQKITTFKMIVFKRPKP